MSLRDRLAERKGAVVAEWLRQAIEAYPADAARFLLQETDPFANPLGRTTAEGLAGLVDELLGRGSIASSSPHLRRIVEVRAIQDFPPSQALAFLGKLKEIVREELAHAGASEGLDHEWLAFDAEVDKLVLAAFDAYMACREKVYELKANEIRNRTAMLLQRTGVLAPEEPCAAGPSD